MLTKNMFSTIILCVFFCVFTKICLGNEELPRSGGISNTPCSLDRDCNENSFCFGNDQVNRGFCRCKDGFIIFRNRTFYECLPPAESVGSSCTRNNQCTLVLGNPSLCLNNTCQCLENSHFVEPQNQCYLTSRPGELCQSDFNCLLSDNSIGNCFMGRCKCPILHHHTDDGRCVPSAYLGDVCTEDDACRHTFAACYDVCRCIGGYAPSSDGRTCLLAANSFGDNCTEVSQCTEYLSSSICQDGTCQCRTGFHGIGPHCWRDVTAGGMCEDRRECFIRNNTMENVGCLDGVCTCLEKFENIRGHCIPSKGTILTSFRLIIAFTFSFLIIKLS
ncbi:prion-like-(Q/N-rich) domain-bearing protein 25 [Onthophagus taurus]|uniref:prion-like-(Q/N-rich) domain-bearing protein 25 n=1 Tax=Onthophagus taurus TaxID=166361 RepID=UPI0039BE3124